MLSHVTPWTAARQAPLSMDFSRQEYWRGLPFPSPWVAIFKRSWPESHPFGWKQLHLDRFPSGSIKKSEHSSWIQVPRPRGWLSSQSRDSLPEAKSSLRCRMQMPFQSVKTVGFISCCKNSFEVHFPLKIPLHRGVSVCQNLQGMQMWWYGQVWLGPGTTHNTGMTVYLTEVSQQPPVVSSSSPCFFFKL